jgi:hypothetical protein
MQPRSEETRSAAVKPALHAGRGRRKKRRHPVRVRVVTDGEVYTGTLKVGRRLRDVLDDGRTYLALWDARLDGSGETEEFVAIHKGAIRSVVVVPGETPALVRSSRS